MSGCGLFPSLDGLAGDASTDALAVDGATTDAGLDADATLDAPTDASTTDGGCPGTAGPQPVSAGGFCIDSTEVTNAQYKSFLAASFGPTSRSECSWKTSYVPTSWPPGSGTDAYPVTYVDWCDAFAFCEWAGKRLCGRIGGGPVALSSATDPNADQWYAACSHAGDANHVYPYGSSFSSATCNVPEDDAGATVPVGSLSACTGGYPSLFDMVGNVYEWEDSCSAASGPTDSCNVRAGSYIDPPGASQTCARNATVARKFADVDFGFRCCAP